MVKRLSNVLAKDLVFIGEGNELFVNSLMIAEETGYEHSIIQRKLRDYKDEFAEFEEVRFTVIKTENSTGGRPQKVYELNEPQASYLITLLDNTEKVRKFKLKLVKEFYRMREELADKRELIKAITDKVKVNTVLTLDDINAERFSIGRTIKTFANADMKVIDEFVHDFNEYVATMDATTRMTRCQSAIAGIQRLHDRLALDGVSNIGHCYNLKQLIIDIKDYRHKIENKRNGGQKAAQTKKTNQLLERVKELDPGYIQDGTCGVYSITNIIDGRKYIGSSKDIKKRLYKHTYDLNMNQHHNERLQKAWNTFGEDNFKFKVAEECRYDELEETENCWIEYESATDEEYGYNIYGRNF